MAAFIPALLSGLAGVGGGLLNRPQTTKIDNTTTTNNSSTGSVTGSSLPVYDPNQLQMRNFLINQFYNQTNPAAIHGLVNNTINTGVNNINDAAGPQQQALQASLAARGLSYSGAAGTAEAQQQSGRIRDIFNLQNQAPLLENQLRQGNLTSFADFFKGLPTGTATQGTSQENTTGTTHQVGTQTGSGNVAGGAVSGAGSALALMYGLGAFGKTKPTGDGG